MLTLVRSLIFNFLLLAYTVILLLGLWVLLPFSRAAMRKAAIATSWVLWWLARYVVGIEERVIGLEHLPKGPAVFAAKHQSAWDTFVFFRLVEDAQYVVKKELMRLIPWRWYANKCGAVTVDRDGGASALKQLVSDTLDRVGKGRQVVIFPEGTRTAPGDRQPYSPGIAAIYRRLPEGVPLVPVAVNSGLMWGRRSFIKRPGTITLEFLEAIEPGLNRRDFMALLESRIEDATARLIADARD